VDTGLTGQATAQHVSAGRSPFRERMRQFTQWSRRHPRIAWVTGATVAGLALFFCFLRLSWTYPAGSDGADQALQAWDVLHGNLLLHGWTIADVTYYTTEIPQYMLIELIRGLGPDVEHIAAASTYTLLLLAAGLLARGRSTGREGLIRFAVAAGIMIAPQFGNATHLLLSQPDHLGTQLPLLLAFLLLDRAPRRWYVPVAVGAILTLVVIADQVAMLTSAVPLAIVCGARALLGVVWHRKSLASQWYELSLVAVAVLSYAAAKLVVRLIIHLHGFQVLPLATKPAPIADIGQHIVLTVEGILNVFAADFLHLSKSSLLGPSLGGLPMAAGIALAAVHLVGVALAVWGFFRAFRYFFDPSDLVSPVLATAIVVNVAAYVLSIVPVTLFDTREIVAVLPFGAVLAGRMVPGTLTRLPRRLKPALAWVSVGVLACYMAGLGYGTAHRPVADFDQAIVPWLEAHHLTTGLGTYFEANLITMDSGGRVAVRTVSWQFTRDVPRRYESKADWYDPRQSYANFIVTNTADNTQTPNGSPRLNSLIPLPAIAALHAGPPAHVYHYKTFTIMVWNHNLLDDLGRTPSTLAGKIPCHVKCI
jgi:hypothetical protein